MPSLWLAAPPPPAGRDARPARRRTARHAPPARPLLLVAAGRPAAALHGVLAALPEATDLVLLLRTATREDRAAGAGLAELTLRRGGHLVELTGAHSALALDAARLRALVADVAGREVHVYGPPAFAAGVLAAAWQAGVPAGRLHGPPSGA